MRFDGDIIITDPCYLFDDSKWGIVYDLYCSSLPRTKLENKNKNHIDDLERRLEVLSFHPHLKCDDLKMEKVKGVIRTIEEELEELMKSENFVFVEDHKQPVYGCLKSLGFSADIIGSTIYGDWSAGVFDSDKKEIIGRFCADAGMYCVLHWDEILKYSPEKAKEIRAKDWCAAIIKDFAGDIEVKIITENFKNSAGEDCVDHSVKIVGTGNINFEAFQTGF